MASGTTLMFNGVTVRNDLLFDLDNCKSGCRIGVMRNGNNVHFFLNEIKDQRTSVALKTSMQSSIFPTMLASQSLRWQQRRAVCNFGELSVLRRRRSFNLNLSKILLALLKHIQQIVMLCCLWEVQ